MSAYINPRGSINTRVVSRFDESLVAAVVDEYIACEYSYAGRLVEMLGVRSGNSTFAELALLVEERVEFHDPVVIGIGQINSVSGRYYLRVFSL